MKTLLVIFKDLRLEREQTEALRKDMNARTQNRYDLLHNHEADGKVVYRYPRIQFRSFQGYAALFGINEGTELIRGLLESRELGEPYTGNYQVVSHTDESVEVGEKFFTYSVREVVPFNAENYRTYRKLESLTERSAFMENKMAIHLVQFCREFGVPFEKGDIRLRLKSMQKVPEPELKGERVLAFDLVMETNLSFPDYLSFGRMKSLGWGTVKRIRS